jgi:hypothetical protein
MIRHTLVKDDLIHIENSDVFVNEIFESTNCDIQTTINNFNSLYKWDKMFDAEEVKRRFEENHRFFIFYHKDLVVGHCWVDPNQLTPNNIYVYNVFVDKTKHDKDVCDSTVYFSKLATMLFSEGYKVIHADVDDWHKKSQSFCQRLGFKSI